MVRRRGLAVVALAAAGVALLLAAAALPATLPAGEPGATYGAATVRFLDECNATLGVVDARVADTDAERYRGLAGVGGLPPDAGMLFVFWREAPRSFVMRNTSVPLDVVFVGGDGRVTAVRSAPVPPPGTDERNLTRYTAPARWVLEIERGWAAAHGVGVGDRVRIEFGNITRSHTSIQASR